MHHGYCSLIEVLLVRTYFLITVTDKDQQQTQF